MSYQSIPTVKLSKKFSCFTPSKVERISESPYYLLNLIVLVRYLKINHFPLITVRNVAKTNTLRTLKDLEKLCILGRENAQRVVDSRGWRDADALSFQLQLSKGHSFTVLIPKIKVNRKGEIVWMAVPSSTITQQIYKDWLMKQFLETGDEYALMRLKGIEHYSDFNTNTLTESIRNNIGRSRYAWWDRPPHEDCQVRLKAF